MEEPQVSIKKIITTVDDEKSYSIDVDTTTTFYEFKKILASAAHLLKNCFRIYLQDQEYTNDYDDNTIQEMFPDLDPVPLRIISNKDINEFEEELVSVSFKITVPCDDHIGKYKVLYCFTCNKSICLDCLALAHKNHKVEEKADYLAPAQLLMNNIFSNSSLYKADTRLSKYMECVNFRSNLKINIFDNLRKLINDLEIKFASCLEFFSTCEDETERNTNENLELLKRYCIECFIKLKNDINTKGIIIDDDIFLTVYHKLKEIERYKTDFFEENKQKYERLNTLLAPFIKQVEKISEEIRISFDNYLNKDIYEQFKNLIQENLVEKIQKETVNDMMFRNLGVPRKSLNRMSLGNFSYRGFGKNKYKSPDKPIGNPFQRATNTDQRQSQSGLGLSSSNNMKNEKVNKNNLTYTKNLEQNIGISEQDERNSSHYQNNQIVSSTTTTNINNMNSMNNMSNINSMSNMNNINSVDNSNVGGIMGNAKRIEKTVTTTTTTNVNNVGNSDLLGRSGRNIEETIVTNISSNNVGSKIKNAISNNANLNSQTNLNMNINTTTVDSDMLNSNINNVISNNNDIHNVKKETTIYQKTESIYPGQTTKYITKKQEYHVHNLGPSSNIGEIQGHIHGQTQNNITKTETITTSTTSNNNLFGQNNKLISTNNISEANRNISNNYSQGYQVNEYTTTTIQHNKISGTQPASTGLFKGDLITVLNNEINKNEQEYHEKNKGQIISETHSKQIIYGSGISGMISPFLFMYPLFETNTIIGALEDQSTGRLNVDFSQAFGEKDIQLNEFPQGGAFSNYGKYLYFTGGQEKKKGIGKIFLRLFLNKTEYDYSIKLSKMPSMIYSHWNHSMIAEDNYIFVVGGYNSNKCEYFNLKNMKWEAMPDLNSEERQRPMLVIHKGYLYAFMGHTQYSILDSIERINITKLGSSKWEKVSISNPNNINLKFYGAGICIKDNEMYFIGGKIGLDEEEKDFKNEIFKFNFDKMEFKGTENSYVGQLNFIENKFHKCDDSTFGNFVDLKDDGCLATITIDSLFGYNNE